MYLLDQAPPLSAYNPVIHNYCRTILDMCTFRHSFTQINALVTVRACVPGSTIYFQTKTTQLLRTPIVMTNITKLTRPKVVVQQMGQNQTLTSFLSKSSWVRIPPAVIAQN